ncbi:hypothetical protein [Lacticaseibacillus hegangensis]|uniref:Uncharacterized protein n=1 Tax=Lacticaseibacillus hegangensis TaxID=2486010 RepID=A0ABW4CXP4_9LACO|nr:hypothetical protein [Lacticaseibacillus hegangensis]
MGELVDPRQGLATADNNRFLRQWFEVSIGSINFNATSGKDAYQSGLKWFPYNKGGAYRKWYGNYDYVVNWERDGYEIKHFTDNRGKVRSRPQNTDYYFREAITWSDVTSGIFSMRWRDSGSIFDSVGMEAFSKDKSCADLKYAMGLMNSKVGNYVLKMLNPTIHTRGGINNIPVLIDLNIDSTVIDSCIRLSKADWDNYEISSNFRQHSLITFAEHPLSHPQKIAHYGPYVPNLRQLLEKDEWRVEING